MKRRLTKHDQMPQTSSEVLTLGLIIVAHDSAEELAPDVPTAGPRLGRVLSRDFRPGHRDSPPGAAGPADDLCRVPSAGPAGAARLAALSAAQPILDHVGKLFGLINNLFQADTDGPGNTWLRQRRPCQRKHAGGWLPHVMTYLAQPSDGICRLCGLGSQKSRGRPLNTDSRTGRPGRASGWRGTRASILCHGASRAEQP